MRRREFLGLLGGSVAALPVSVARAKGMPNVGVLWHAGSEQEEALFL